MQEDTGAAARRRRACPQFQPCCRLQSLSPAMVPSDRPLAEPLCEQHRWLYVLVGAGALMMMVGFFGCCGAVRESQCLLGAFFACLLVIFAAEVTSGVFAFLGKNVAIQEVQAIYKDAYDAYMKNPGEKNRTLQLLHSSFQCCGKGKDSEDQVKPTCPEGIHLPKNCLEEIQSVTNSHLHLVGIVGIAIAGVTIFGMIFSMVLCCAIRNTRDTL